MSKEFELQDVKKLIYSEETSAPSSTVDELHQEISKPKDRIRDMEIFVEKLLMEVNEAAIKKLKISEFHLKICVSAKSEIKVLAETEKEVMMIETTLHDAETEDHNKASIICPESEIEALGECKERNPEQLSAQVTRWSQKLQSESQSFLLPFRACDKALQLRWSKFERNATLLKRQLTWQFNGHLKKKGISDFTKKRATRSDEQFGIKTVNSGGERSFLKLCFALALHEMTESHSV